MLLSVRILWNGDPSLGNSPDIRNHTVITLQKNGVTRQVFNSYGPVGHERNNCTATEESHFLRGSYREVNRTSL
jgi:hypothetical protein